MSGIYIHVPFCKHKCDYCDFYSIVSNEGLLQFDKIIEKEVELRVNYLADKKIETVYFGGGTPSLLGANQIGRIRSTLNKYFEVLPDAEVTLEANPDDLNREVLNDLLSVGVNRLSIGVQSFSDNDLYKLQRRHSAKQAIDAVNIASSIGFNNISIDLIYGLPYSSTEIWKENLNIAFGLPIKHLSCYHLIYEDQTPLSNRVAKGDVVPVSEDQSVEQFRILQEQSKKYDFIHYEISNLAKEGYFSKHNSSYWKMIPYLGLGPSAHSFNGLTRDWNPKSILRWRNSIEKNSDPSEKEILNQNEMFNDYIITSLRTIWGTNLNYIEVNFGTEKAYYFKKTVQKYIEEGVIENIDKVYRIRSENFFTSDGIIVDLLLV